MNAKEYTAKNFNRGEFSADEKEHIRKRLEFLVQRGFSFDGCVYTKDNVGIIVTPGRHDERDDILVIQNNYYDYSGVNERMRAFVSTMRGIHKITFIESKVRKNGCRDIFDKDRMERFEIFADYLEKNLDSILSDPGPKSLRKYHEQAMRKKLVDDFREEIRLEIEAGDIKTETLKKYKKLGMEQKQMFDVLEAFRAEMRLKDDEKTEDMIMECMDVVCGWCSPQAKIYPELPYDPNL